jgi:hypothetical protein
VTFNLDAQSDYRQKSCAMSLTEGGSLLDTGTR